MEPSNATPTASESTGGLAGIAATLDRVRRVAWWIGAALLAAVLVIAAAGALAHAGGDAVALAAALVAAALGALVFAAAAVLDA